MSNEERDESSSNIDVLWLKAVYEDLRDLGNHIILSKTGFRNMEELVSLPEEQLVEIQLRNLKLIIIKFLNILDNVQTKVSKAFFKKTKKQLKIVEKAINEEETGQRKPHHFRWRSDVRIHSDWRELTDNFHKTLDCLDSLKTELIKELDPILYFIQEGSPLDKTKQKKKRR